MKARGVVIVIAVLAVVAAALSTTGGDDGGGGGGSGAKPAAGATRIPFAISPEKEQLLQPLVERFNKRGGAFVEMSVVASGEAQTRIAKGTLEPVLWSPSSSFWGRLLNFEADRPLAPDENPSIVRTPLVIAMWEELARAYGYPRRSLGFSDLARLATDGWKSIGRPEFGSFKYVHTNPDFSTSGLSAVAAAYYATTGKKEGLTVGDVERDAVRSQVREIERSIVHYGDTTLFIADELRRGGLGYASAVAMEETTLLDFNAKAPRGQRLVAVYPREGTFFSDNPLITLDAPWVTAKQREGAKEFAAFLAGEVDAELAGRFGFRPPDEAAAPAGRVTRANGVDPAQPKRTLKVPEPRVLVRLKQAWREDRKPATVLLVLDNSGSMGEEDKLDQAKEGLKAFFASVEDQDQVGLWKFSTDITPLVGIGPLASTKPKLEAALEAVFPEDDTRVYDAAVEAVRAVEERGGGADRIRAVVLLTDGEDTASGRNANAALRELQRQGRRESAGRVRLFTIAYGLEPDEKVLQSFAQATGGKGFQAGLDDIEAVYRSISSFF